MSPLRNRLLCVDGLEGMRSLPASSVPLTVTSPPYDSIREYGGHLWDHEKFALVAHELWRATMPGGVVCWVVRDQIKQGSQTCTCFRQAIFLRNLGFNLHNTIVVEKHVSRGLQRDRYGVAPEFTFVFSKGRPRSANLLKRENINGGRRLSFSASDRSGTRSRSPVAVVNEFGNLGIVWRYATGGRATAREAYAYEHPALMPEALARDLIASWSRPGDVVLDPMGGAGTTAKVALLSDRQYLSFEVHRPYHEIAVRRLREAHRLNASRLVRSLGIE